MVDSVCPQCGKTGSAVMPLCGKDPHHGACKTCATQLIQSNIKSGVSPLELSCKICGAHVPFENIRGFLGSQSILLAIQGREEKGRRDATRRLTQLAKDLVRGDGAGTHCT